MRHIPDPATGASRSVGEMENSHSECLNSRKSLGLLFCLIARPKTNLREMERAINTEIP